MLHTRHYRDTSLLVEWLTPDYGRISSVVRGVRGAFKKKSRVSIQPFVPWFIEWRGTRELKTIYHYEAQPKAAPLLQETRLFSALYINEMLLRLLKHSDKNVVLFLLYEQTLYQLQDATWLDIVLRHFELKLLGLLGYAIDFYHEGQTKQLLLPDKRYHFYIDKGFVEATDAVTEALSNHHLFTGEDIMTIRLMIDTVAFDQNDATLKRARQAAKRLCRLALAPHLGNKPLKSRELFSLLP